MIYSTDILAIEDAALALATSILAAPSTQDYDIAKKKVAQSSEASQLQQEFLAAKHSFAKIEEYGVHAPDYKKRQLEMRRAKRHLDMVPEVITLRQTETQVQETLDEVTAAMAKLISADIIVDYGNAFFHQKKHHHDKGCQGGCQHVG